jgi:hypothetical protein
MLIDNGYNVGVDEDFKGVFKQVVDKGPDIVEALRTFYPDWYSTGEGDSDSTASS